MAYAFVQQVQATAAANTVGAAITPTAGNGLIIVTSNIGNGATISTLGDGSTTSDVYTSALIQQGGTFAGDLALYYVQNCSATTRTVSVTYGAGGGSNSAIYVAEYSGLAKTGMFLIGAGQGQASPGSTTDAISSTAASVTGTPALIFGFSCDITNASSLAPTTGTGFTSRTAVWVGYNSTTANPAAPEDVRLTSNGSKAATFTATGGSNFDNFVTIFGAFAEASTNAATVAWIV